MLLKFRNWDENKIYVIAQICDPVMAQSMKIVFHVCAKELTTTIKGKLFVSFEKCVHSITIFSGKKLEGLPKE